MATEPGWQIVQADWTQHHTQLMSVRTAVFVDEQGIPAELEEDAHDPSSQHVAAIDAQGQWLGTGRLLPDGHIGRMAVLAPYRNQGFGAAILKKLITLGKRHPHQKLRLSAQIGAENFYARHGFCRIGAPYNEVGIAHIAMQMDLRKEPFRVQHASNAVRCAIGLANEGRQEILIFSHHLAEDLFDQPGFVASCKDFLTKHQRATVRVLVHDAKAVVTDGCQLLGLMQRLPSKAAVRVVSRDYTDHEERLLIVDKTAYLQLNRPEAWDGRAAWHAPAEAQKLRRFFNEVWEQANEDPNLRPLSWG